MRNKIFSVTKNTNFHDNTFTLLQRIYCQNISVSLHNLRKSPIFAKYNNANVHCHKENNAFENELTTLLQIWHKFLTGKGNSTVHITWTFSIRNLAKTDLQLFRHLFTQNSKDVFKLNELFFVWSQFLHKFSMLKESLCLVLSQIPWTKTKLAHIWVSFE